VRPIREIVEDEDLARPGLARRLEAPVAAVVVDDQQVAGGKAPGELDGLRALVSSQMCGAFPLSVPLDVSFGTGRSWEEAGH